MRITIKLYAMLSKYLPPGAEHNASSLQMPDGASIDAVVVQLNLPRELVHLVLLNGVFVPPDRRPITILKEDDTVAIWPPVAGG